MRSSGFWMKPARRWLCRTARLKSGGGPNWWHGTSRWREISCGWRGSRQAEAVPGRCLRPRLLAREHIATHCSPESSARHEYVVATDESIVRLTLLGLACGGRVCCLLLGCLANRRAVDRHSLAQGGIRPCLFLGCRCTDDAGRSHRPDLTCQTEKPTLPLLGKRRIPGPGAACDLFNYRKNGFSLVQINERPSTCRCNSLVTE